LNNRPREVEEGLFIRKTREQDFEPPKEAHASHSTYAANRVHGHTSTNMANANHASHATDAELQRATTATAGRRPAAGWTRKISFSVRAELANESRVVQFAGSKTTRVIGFFR
jgi:hypothetical protein